MNIDKLSKLGGCSAMRCARDPSIQFDAGICAECIWGSDNVTAASLQFAASTPQGSLLNTCDLASYVAPPVGPDLGITPNPDILGTPILKLA
ncbi:MAG: hypothetical protein KC448_07600 [Yoonia sp.]|nr:hypothetical protein [Yoonia sp.]